MNPTVYVETSVISDLTARRSRDIVIAAHQQLTRRWWRSRSSYTTVDAFHIGIAAAHQIEYLLTWNCKHIANATIRGTIEAICHSAGLTPPII